MKKNKTDYPVKTRNIMLLNMFRQHNISAQLVGDINQPSIVIDGNFAISGFVKNRIYNFTNKPFGGFIVDSIYLNEETEITKTEIQEFVYVSEVRKLWKIQVCVFGKEPVYLYSIDNNKVLFSLYDAKYFFSEEKAQEFINTLVKYYNFEEDNLTIIEGNTDIESSTLM